MKIVTISSAIILISLWQAGKAQNCEAASNCKNPLKNVVDSIKCHLSTAFNDRGIETIIGKVGSQLCQGKTFKDIASGFVSIASSAVDLSTVGKLMGVMGKYDKCLKGAGLTQKEAASLIGQCVTSTFSSDIKKVESKLKGMKDCQPNKIKDAAAAELCPLLKTSNLQKVIDGVKKAHGKAGFQCAVDILDPTIILMTQYKGVKKSN